MATTVVPGRHGPHDASSRAPFALVKASVLAGAITARRAGISAAEPGRCGGMPLRQERGARAASSRPPPPPFFLFQHLFAKTSQSSLFGVAFTLHSGKLVLLPVKAGKRGVETPWKPARSQFHWGRVACAHVQPATVKAHAPAVSTGFEHPAHGRRPEMDIGATDEPRQKRGSPMRSDQAERSRQRTLSLPGLLPKGEAPPHALLHAPARQPGRRR
jgi:hypothetical protein